MALICILNDIVMQLGVTSLVVAAISLFITYYLISAVNKPKIICKRGKFHDHMMANMPILSQYFWPTFWCMTGRLQTIVQGIMNGMEFISIDYKREIIRTKDGGEIALDWVDNDDNSSYESHQRPTVIIVPGLAGSSNDDYIKRMVQVVLDQGYRVVVFNNRGLGGLKLKTPRSYAMPNSEDTRTVVLHVRAKFPLVPLLANGFSAGAVTLFHYLKNFGEDCQLVGAMLNSCLFDAFESTKNIESFPNKIILNKHLAYNLTTDVVKPNIEVLSQKKELDIPHILQSKTAREYHTRLTVPMFGYKDWTHLYNECTLNGNFHKVKIPILILNAEDDPFAPPHSIPFDEIENQENVVLALLSHGGHNAFLKGLLPTGHSHDVDIFSQFVSAMFRDADICHRKIAEVNSNCF